LKLTRVKIEEILINLGAKKTFDGNIQTMFLDYKDSAINRQGNLLRLRKNTQKTELTYKKVTHTQTVKIAEECSVEVSGFETMLIILGNLGLNVTGNMEKHRLSYKLEKVQF